jgi:hypothetical protein
VSEISSIFEIKELSLLKGWNIKYGTKFSLYLFYEKKGFNLRFMTHKFRREWRENADWLRMSFHARTKRFPYPDFPYGEIDQQTDYETAKKDLQDVRREVFRFAGTDVWESITRTHYWSGSRESVKAWRDNGIKGLFISASPQIHLPPLKTTYFSKSQLENLWSKDYWYDHEFNMLYIATNVMLPGKSVLDVKNRLESLTERRIIEAWCDDYNVVELKEHIAEVIKWCSKHKYEPAFYEDVFCIE